MPDFRISLNVLKILQHLLTHLDQPQYALELGRATGISNGALLPALDKLEKGGFLTSGYEDIDESTAGRRKRRYFTLTERGVALARAELTSAPTLPTGLGSLA